MIPKKGNFGFRNDEGDFIKYDDLKSGKVQAPKIDDLKKEIDADVGKHPKNTKST